MQKPDIEERIQSIGAEIASSLKGETPTLFDKKKWISHIIEWAVKSNAFKLRLLRFIDVLPSLQNDELIIRVLKEYFAEEEIVPLLVKWGLQVLPEKGIISEAEASIVRKGVETLAKQFFAGRDPEEAVKTLEGLWKEGVSHTIDLLGEVVVSDREAREYAERYMRLLDFLAPFVKNWESIPILDNDNKGALPRLDISVKVSSFFSQIDPIDWEGSVALTREGLLPVLTRAQELGAAVTIDMEHYYLKGLILEIFRTILEDGLFSEIHAGIALQTYLKESKQDLSEFIAWTKKIKRPVGVRLVKGAYWDYEIVANRQRGWPVPVFLDKAETDRNFEECTLMLLENAQYVRPAIATHNIRSISHAIAVAEHLELPRDAFEFQLLYGMAEPMRRVLQKMGYRVRVYTPVGELIPGMAYLVRRILENTSNESVLRMTYMENIPFETLMAQPRPRTEKEKYSNNKSPFRNDSTTDFSNEENRKKMVTALKKVKKKLGRRYPLIVGGREIETGEEMISVNPARPDELIGKISSASQKDADTAVEAALDAWSEWRNIPSEERAQCLFRAAEEMRSKRFDLSALEVYEVGKTWKEADGDVAEAIDFCEYYGREMLRLGNPQILGDYPGEENIYLYEPRGIGLVISPWNFPLAIPTGMTAAGLVTGNCIIFKPAGLSAVTGYHLAEVFLSAGIPQGVLQFLPGPGDEVGEYLVSHPSIDFIAFTGSKDVGLRIVRLAGETHKGQRNVKKVIAEMGGKNTVIIDETADLDEAVKGVLESALGYQGQKCSACSRVIVIGDAFNYFCERLKEAMESIRIGPPEKPSSFMGPVVDKTSIDKIDRYIRIGKKEATPVLIRDVKTDGYFLGPVLFRDVLPESSIAQEEIFGPVLAVMRADNIDEAIDIANNTIYALTGGIFSRSPANIEKVRKDMRAGNIYVNRKITAALVGRQPFGGFGMSGVGSKAGGPDYLLQFLNPKSISENTMRRGYAPLE